MTTKTDGGQTFPVTDMRTHGSYGMTLRDWFAGLTLQGICASGPGREWNNARLAKEAYQLADAMLKARENTP